MHNFCDIHSITWTDPIARWLWERVCGGNWLVITIIVIVLVLGAIGGVMRD